MRSFEDMAKLGMAFTQAIETAVSCGDERRVLVFIACLDVVQWALGEENPHIDKMVAVITKAFDRSAPSSSRVN